jgi:pimeloyl-ACP methyl ester carboxylesterase/DNA-binding CsgD family transcriptional regulator
VRAAHWLTHIEFEGETPVWRPWFDALGARYRFLRYDSRGCGLSRTGDADVALDVLVSDLEAIVDAAGLGRFALLGTSQGGAISIAYAAKHPERVSHLVLLGAFARGPLVRNPTPEKVASIEAQLKLVELGWGTDNPAFHMLFTSQLFPNATPAQLHALNELQRRSCPPAQAARILEAACRIDAAPCLDQVRCPTLVLHARRDQPVPYESEGVRIAARIPDARLVTLESASHVPLPGDPAFTRVMEEIAAFLPAPHAAAFPRLTPREAQILDLMAAGLDNAQIGARLEVSEKTVRNNVTRIFEKMGVENRPQAIVQAREAGLGRIPLAEARS